MESLTVKNGKPGIPVKSKKSAENANPNISHASPCVAYEEFFKKPSESEDCCDVGDGDELQGEESVEPELIGACNMKRTRAKVVEESRRSVPESGKVMNLVQAFEKLTCFSHSKTANKDEEDMKKPVKLELCGMRQQSKFSEGEKEPHHPWSYSFCPAELVLTAKNLGLDPNASVSLSWDSSHGSVLSGSSNAARNVCVLDS